MGQRSRADPLKKSVGCSVMPAFFHGSFSDGVRLNLQQVAGGGQPARPRRRGPSAITSPLARPSSQPASPAAGLDAD
jgi:hypothetical protein